MHHNLAHISNINEKSKLNFLYKYQNPRSNLITPTHDMYYPYYDVDVLSQNTMTKYIYLCYLMLFDCSTVMQQHD